MYYRAGIPFISKIGTARTAITAHSGFWQKPIPSLSCLAQRKCPFFSLGRLLADDFPPEVIKYLSGKAILSVDAQGYLREVKGDKVSPIDWPEKQEILKYIDILKVNEHEATVLTGYTNPQQAAEQLSAWGVKEVLLTLGSLGSIILADGVCYKIPAYPPLQTIDATGCGDTYVMGYLYMRNKGVSYPEAGCFAAALSTLKLEKSGPWRQQPKRLTALSIPADRKSKFYKKDKYY